MGVRIYKLHQWAETLPVDVTRFSGIGWSMKAKTLDDFRPVGTMTPVETVPPGTPSRKVKLPTAAEKNLSSYCRSGWAGFVDFPMVEEWAREDICPECETQSVIAKDDYICIICRNA